ncbi:MAG: DUF3558 domain-containing protein [Actinomycetota bacterium]|nr:DUF3558 domain-containing protein [Actinomycetota bacterium]
MPEDVVTGSSQPSTATDTSDPDEDLPYAGAPEVPNPLDTESFQRDPCTTLTNAQVDELKAQSGKPHDGGLGNACEFRSRADRLALIDIAFADEYPHGLSALYQGNKDGKWAFFEELPPIEGFPAVAYDSVDQRDTGACAVDVGTSNDIAFEVSLQLSAGNVGKKDPCETAAMVAGMVVQTMKAAQ